MKSITIWESDLCKRGRAPSHKASPRKSCDLCERVQSASLTVRPLSPGADLGRDPGGLGPPPPEPPFWGPNFCPHHDSAARCQLAPPYTNPGSTPAHRSDSLTDLCKRGRMRGSMASLIGSDRSHDKVREAVCKRVRERLILRERPWSDSLTDLSYPIRAPWTLWQICLIQSESTAFHTASLAHGLSHWKCNFSNFWQQ